MQRSALCRSRRELSNEYLLAKIGVDTAENEPLEVWGKIIKIFNIIHWCPYREVFAQSMREAVSRAHAEALQNYKTDGAKLYRMNQGVMFRHGWASFS